MCKLPWITMTSGRPLRAGCLAGFILMAAALTAGCDHDAETVFRQTATEPIGEGVKTFLGGDPELGVGEIVTAIIDGAVASIVQAGDGPATDG